MYDSVLVKNGVLWIDGIHMQRFEGITPSQSAKQWISVLGLKKGETILDICTGLGYTVLEEAKLASKVITIELSSKVLDVLKESNNKNLFDLKNVEVLHGNAFELVGTFEDSSFDCILHDPPRFSMAGELYSLVFYQQLYRLLKNNGRLFHYTGKPGLRQGKNLVGGIERRLKESGFNRVSWIEESLGFKCLKK